MAEPRAGTDHSHAYVLVIEDDDGPPFAFADDVSIGRHLDNDLIVAGEDVADFHARIEVGPRSLQLVPLPGCVVQHGAVSLGSRFGLMPGERFALGVHAIRFEVAGGDADCQWHLMPPDGKARIAVGVDMTVGRSVDCALRLQEGHVSRHHARISRHGDGLWLKDLQSSNGTFVNGERVTGACRLFHGDVICFDTQSFQLVGDDPELTPVVPFDPSLPLISVDGPIVDAAALPGNTTQLNPVAEPAAAGSPARESPERGPVLRGVSQSVAGRVFRLNFGRYLIGRSDDADICITDDGVSLRHAELDVRPDGVFISNLMSTNGTVVNGTNVHTTRLRHRDRVRLGRVVFEFCKPPGRAAARSARAWMRWPTARRGRLLWAGTGAGAVLLLLLAYLSFL